MIEQIVESSPKVIEAVSKYKLTFILIILFGCNIYQFIDCKSEMRRLNEVIRIKDEKALEYEKERGSRYEFLLNNLPKVKSDDEKK